MKVPFLSFLQKIINEKFTQKLSQLQEEKHPLEAEEVLKSDVSALELFLTESQYTPVDLVSSELDISVESPKKMWLHPVTNLVVSLEDAISIEFCSFIDDVIEVNKELALVRSKEGNSSKESSN